jgi:hypothetical protein
MTPTQSPPSFNADLLLQAASILDEMSTTSEFEQPPPTQAAPNDIIFLTTADEDFEDLRSADGVEGAREPLCWLDDEDDNAGVQEDDELFGPAENPLVTDESLEYGVHQGNDSEPMETQSTLPVSNGAYAWELRKPPSIRSAAEALRDLKIMLKPRRATGRGYRDPQLDGWMRERFESMYTLLTHYTSVLSPGYKAWMSASLLTATGKGKPTWWARQLRSVTKSYVLDRITPPTNPYGMWSSSRLEDPDIANEIHEHLQSVGKYVRAQDIVDYLDKEDVKTRFGMKKTISLATAKRWMHRMDYRWTRNFKGQYVDGHERDDVVWYRQNVFLKQWAEMEEFMHTWDPDESANNTNFPADGASLPQREICVWFHDESTFYANDRRMARWVHKDATATPYAKGEGASLMVADFVSADHGWLRSPDGKESARVLFKAGKARDGYFTNDDIVAQARKAIKLVKEYFPDEDHVLVFDNATTHLKRPDAALSARKMPKHPSKEGTNWGIEVTAKDAAGKIVYGTDGKPSKVKVRMGDGTFKDGSPQSLYFPDGHPRAGIFKGMAVILEERGYCDMLRVRAECPGFICDPIVERCCCRRMLYNESDFVNVKSTLELACALEGVHVLFLPKFHCELNFIEQCWGHAKRTYRQYPASSKEEDLERNVVDALQSVTLDHMRK